MSILHSYDAGVGDNWIGRLDDNYPSAVLASLLMGAARSESMRKRLLADLVPQHATTTSRAEAEALLDSIAAVGEQLLAMKNVERTDWHAAGRPRT